MKNYLFRFESFVGRTMDDLRKAIPSRWSISRSEEGWNRYLHFPTGQAVQVFYGANEIITQVVIER